MWTVFVNIDWLIIWFDRFLRSRISLMLFELWKKKNEYFIISKSNLIVIFKNWAFLWPENVATTFFGGNVHSCKCEVWWEFRMAVGIWFPLSYLKPNKGMLGTPIRIPRNLRRWSKPNHHISSMWILFTVVDEPNQTSH